MCFSLNQHHFVCHHAISRENKQSLAKLKEYRVCRDVHVLHVPLFMFFFVYALLGCKSCLWTFLSSVLQARPVDALCPGDTTVRESELLDELELSVIMWYKELPCVPMSHFSVSTSWFTLVSYYLPRCFFLNVFSPAGLIYYSFVLMGQGYARVLYIYIHGFHISNVPYTFHSYGSLEDFRNGL